MHLYLIMFFPSGSQSSWEEQTRKDGMAMQKQEELLMWQKGTCLWKPSATTEADNSEIKFSGASQLAEGSFCGT